MTGRGRQPGGSDLVVVGAGLVGLACAAAAARRGLSVVLLADVRRGEASAAAAGVLAAAIDPAAPEPLAFALAARDRFPSYLADLREHTGIDVPLNRLGILRVAEHSGDEERVRNAGGRQGRWLDAQELAELEPALANRFGAVLHPDDGAVNNLVLLRALKSFVGRHPRVRILADAAVAIHARRSRISIDTRAHATIAAARVVIAAGCWSAQLGGLPRPLPVTPVRGQMVSLAGSPLRHVVMGSAGYVVPRGDGRTLVGSTMEDTGYDAATTDEGIRAVRAIGAAICPPLETARLLSGWAGLRPMTPDGQPILGADPEEPAVLYATGHSRNGVLLSPLTGDVIAALAAGDPPAFDLAPFSPRRFPAVLAPG